MSETSQCAAFSARLHQDPNWDVELLKCLLVEQLTGLRIFCLKRVNQFLDGTGFLPLLGTYHAYLKKIQAASDYSSLEYLVLEVLDAIDHELAHIESAGEGKLPAFPRNLPQSLSLPALREIIYGFFIRQILPLFTSPASII